MTQFPIYLVSMKQDFQKRDEMKKRFPRYYEKMNVIEGVNGKELSAKAYFDYAVPMPTVRARESKIFGEGRILCPGEVGCSLSHIEVMKKILAQDSPFALVLEDDIIGDDNTIETAFELASNAVKDKDFCLLCGSAGNMRMSASNADMKPAVHLQTTFYKVHPQDYRYLWHTCSYVVTRGVAQQVLDKQSDFMSLADDWNYLLKAPTLFPLYYAYLFDHPDDRTESLIESARKRSSEYFDSMVGKIDLKKLIKSKVKAICPSFLYNMLRELKNRLQKQKRLKEMER